MNSERLRRLPSYRAVQEAKWQQELSRHNIKHHRFSRPTWGVASDPFEAIDHKLTEPQPEPKPQPQPAAATKPNLVLKAGDRVRVLMSKASAKAGDLGTVTLVDQDHNDDNAQVAVVQIDGQVNEQEFPHLYSWRLEKVEQQPAKVDGVFAVGDIVRVKPGRDGDPVIQFNRDRTNINRTYPGWPEIDSQTDLLVVGVSNDYETRVIPVGYEKLGLRTQDWMPYRFVHAPTA